MASEKNLQKLFHETLKDIYFAEKKLLSALPEMANAAQSRDLKAAFEVYMRPRPESALIIFIVAVFILLQREDLRDRLIRLFGSAICTARRWRWDDARRSS